MYRKLFYLFGGAAGSIGIGYGVKNKFQNSEYIVKAQEGEKISEDLEKFVPKFDYRDKEIIPLNRPVVTTPYDGYEAPNPLDDAIYKARELAYRMKDEVGAPGLVIGVSIDGITIWAEGIGLADVENRVSCHPETVMRIASISKSMTMAVVARLWQEGKLDLDKPVQHYVPSFPKKKFNKEEVNITTRQLVSHLSGIRHYKKLQEIENEKKKKKDNTSQEKKNEKSLEPEEFYIKERYDSIKESLKLFQNDDLLSKPGSTYHYTTHGFTLVSAVVEAVTKEPFTKVMLKFFQEMGLKHTYIDVNDSLIYYRSRYYCKDARGRLKNVPYVDISYKWAGGGFLSTVGDLLQFGNVMLYSYQWYKDLDPTAYPAGYLESDTIKKMWTKVTTNSLKWGRGDGYGMGWVVIPSQQEYGGGDIQKFAVGHTGGAVGASSVLLIVPSPVQKTAEDVFQSSNLPSSSCKIIPKGIIVSVIMNLQGVSLDKLALDVATVFCEAISS